MVEWPHLILCSAAALSVQHSRISSFEFSVRHVLTNILQLIEFETPCDPILNASGTGSVDFLSKPLLNAIVSALSPTSLWSIAYYRLRLSS